MDLAAVVEPRPPLELEAVVVLVPYMVSRH
jgi:hypothetical protein